MARDVIVLEFNELTPSLMDRFIGEGRLPNFEALRRRSIIARTDAGAVFPNLEPWIQWVTVHTGLTHQEHKVFDLSDGPDLKEPRIWDLASRDGKAVWVCGSMNAAVQEEKLLGLVLPDPWATGIKAQPEGLFDPFLDLVRPFVQEHTTGRPALSLGVAARFVTFMLANGLSLKTILDTVRQLAAERTAPVMWRRAAILDRLLWDVFRHFYRRRRPALSTLFLNSTAHFQHYHWRDMEPDRFAVRSTLDARAKYDEAILFGYRKMDELVGECLRMAGPETAIVFCTGLSQQPMLDYEDIGGKQIFKIKDPASFFTRIGVERHAYAPVMAEQFHLLFDNEADAASALERLRACVLDDGSQVMMARRDGARVFAGCDLVKKPAPGARVTLPGGGPAVPFDALFYPVEAVRSGMHDPAGMLWIALPERRHEVLERTVALTEIAPTLLHLAGVRTDHRFAKSVMPEVLGEGAPPPAAEPAKAPVLARPEHELT